MVATRGLDVAAVTPADAEPSVAPPLDADGFAALYEAHAAALYRYAYQRVGEQTAQDVVADTFLAAFRQREAYDVRRAPVRPWLFGILTRKLARHYRTEKARYRALARTAADAVQDGPADAVAARASADAVRAPLAKALRRLSQADRDVLLLIAWCDLTYEEVATALDVPIGTVRSRLHRARRKVRDALGGTDPTREELC
ncbi:RNA polymerase sigma factor [Actinoplanes sp. NPDC049548]|uniref:RNA polymerase sigma factor n=1 Tax=Actinoplanes sp. NPDC049548 TaxID=3155152 RepID=UPI0034256E3A